VQDDIEQIPSGICTACGLMCHNVEPAKSQPCKRKRIQEVDKLAHVFFSSRLMLVKCDRFALGQLPATNATTGTIGTVTAANFPTFGRIFALENHFSGREVVRVVTLPLSPVGKDDLEVGGDLVVVGVLVHDLKLLCEHQHPAMRIAGYNINEAGEIISTRNIARNMNPKITSHFQISVKLAEIAFRIVVQNVKVAGVGIAYGLTDLAELASVTTPDTGCIRSASGYRGKGNAGHRAHLAIAVRDRNIFCKHGFYPFFFGETMLQ
jgi:hypothetical protein